MLNLKNDRNLRIINIAQLNIIAQLTKNNYNGKLKITKISVVVFDIDYSSIIHRR